MRYLRPILLFSMLSACILIADANCENHLRTPQKSETVAKRKNSNTLPRVTFCGEAPTRGYSITAILRENGQIDLITLETSFTTNALAIREQLAKFFEERARRLKFFRRTTIGINDVSLQIEPNVRAADARNLVEAIKGAGGEIFIIQSDNPIFSEPPETWEDPPILFQKQLI